MRKNNILLFTLLIISLCGYLFTAIATNSIINFKSAFTNRNFGASKPSDQLVNSVYLVVVNGLTFNQIQSGNMPYLQKMIKNKQATLSRTSNNVTPYSTSLVTLITGANGDLTGFIPNEKLKAIPITDIFTLAAKQGQVTAASSDLNQAIKINNIYRPNLMLIQTTGVATTAKKYGVKSIAYNQAVKNTDSLLWQFYNQVPDNSNSLFIITSDKSPMPFIFIGKGVQLKNPNIEINQTDIAPTINAVLGLPFTPYMQGRIISEIFNFNEKSINDKKYLLLEQKKEFIKLFAQKTGTTPVLNDSNPDTSFLYMDDYIKETKAEKLNNGYINRLFIIHVIFFSTLVIYFKFFKPGRGFIIYYKVPALVYFIGFNIFYFAQGYTYTFNYVPTNLELTIHLALSAIIGFLMAIGVQIIISRKFTLPPKDINPILHLSISIIIGLLWITLYTYSQIGIKIDMFLPNMNMFVLQLVTIIQITVVAFAAFLFDISMEIKKRLKA